MNKVKYYKSKDFNKFDWNKLKQNKFKRSGENYNFSKGGVNFINGPGFQLCIYDENGFDKEMWELPEILSKFIDQIFQDGIQKNKENIRKAIGL